MSFDYEIHITNEDPREDTKIRMFARRKKKDRFFKSDEGKEVRTTKTALFSHENEIFQKMLQDEDVREEILERHDEIDLELAGKEIGYTSTLLTDSEYNLCYNFTEYEIKRNREGKIIPCNECGSLYCEHRIKLQRQANVNSEEEPIRWIKIAQLDKLEALQKWSFSTSYQLRHTDGLKYKFLYDMAKKLHDSGKMVLMAPVRDKKPQKLVLHNGGTQFYAWLEGRVKGDKYALILHRTTLRLVD